VINHDEHNVFVERYELQPVDPQTNGPQLFYALRYHTHVVKPGEVETFHDQVGYWLWEPAAHRVVTRSRSRAWPSPHGGRHCRSRGDRVRGQRDLELRDHGILSNPFLDRVFHTISFRMRVIVNDESTWS
jgi:hypothetical protein